MFAGMKKYLDLPKDHFNVPCFFNKGHPSFTVNVKADTTTKQVKSKIEPNIPDGYDWGLRLRHNKYDNRSKAIDLDDEEKKMWHLGVDHNVKLFPEELGENGEAHFFIVLWEKQTPSNQVVDVTGGGSAYHDGSCPDTPGSAKQSITINRIKVEALEKQLQSLARDVRDMLTTSV